jgi:hypothetical protein
VTGPAACKPAAASAALKALDGALPLLCLCLERVLDHAALVEKREQGDGSAGLHRAGGRLRPRPDDQDLAIRTGREARVARAGQRVLRGWKLEELTDLLAQQLATGDPGQSA